MPGEDKEKISLDFGIEEIMQSAGDKEVFTALYGDDDGITPNDKKDKSSTTDKTTTKPVAQKQQATPKKETEDQVDVEEVVLGTTSEEDDDTTEGGDEGKDKNAGDKSVMASLAEDFMGMGIFQKVEGEDVNPNLTPEEFLELYQKNNTRVINDTLENFLSRYGDDYKEMFDAVFVKGVDPKTYLGHFSKLSDIANLDMKIEANQVKVYTEYLRKQGFAEDKIEARVQKAKVNGDLEEDSTDFQKVLAEQEAKDLQSVTDNQEQKKLGEKRQKQVFAQNANKVLVDKVQEKEFDGIPVSDQIARRAMQFLTAENWKLPTGEDITEFDKFMLELRRPENHALKVKVALLAMNNFDLTKVKIKEKNENTSTAFAWATKGKATPVKTGQKAQTLQKETEPFI